MLGHLGETLNAALAIVAVATLAGLGLTRGHVNNLRERLGDYEKEVSEKDRRLTEAETEITRLKTKVNSQAHDLEAVGRLIRGESYWTELGEKLDSHHNEAKNHWNADERKLDGIQTTLAGLRTDLRKRGTA